jgi:hypothetical protein
MNNFYGISIKMYFDDDNVLRFYATYDKFQVNMTISDLEILEGDVSLEIKKSAEAWIKEHQKELKKNWNFYKMKKPKKFLLKFKPKLKSKILKRPIKVRRLPFSSSHKKIFLIYRDDIAGVISVSGFIFFLRCKNWGR